MKANNGKKSFRENEAPIYLTPDSTLQTPAESRQDKEHDVTRDDSISVSHDDLHDPNTERSADNDEAGSNRED